jgi:hypothetical protein
MPSKLVSVLQIVLLALLPAFVSAGQGEQWYSYCAECKEHLGGSGVAGPYPSKEVCEENVAREKASGNPFGPCELGGNGGTHDPNWIHKHPVRFGVLGLFAGGAITWAAFGDTNFNSKQSKEALAAGAAGGFLLCFGLAKLTAGPASSQQNPFRSPLAGRGLKGSQGFAASITFDLNRHHENTATSTAR